jgi:tetratricopeptide (TPR) repeat protein
MTVNEEKYSAIQKMLVDHQHDDAMSALQQFIVACDDYAPSHFDLGNLHYAAGRMNEALSHYKETVELDPENPIYMKNLADLLYSEKKDVEHAINLYEKILTFNPEDIQTLMIMGHLCVSLERFNDALDYYNRILDIEPWNDEAQQFVDQLIAHRVVSGSDMAPETICQRCKDLVSRGQVGLAITELESLAVDHPDFALAHNDLGVLYYQQGDKDRCLQSYEVAVSLDPTNTNFQKNLADFYLAEQGRVEEALRLYLSVLRADPEDIEALMVAGHICVALGKIESARVFYDRVLDVEPWNLEASEHLEKLAVDLS